MTNLETFCVLFPEDHPYAGAYLMVKAENGTAAEAAMRMAHGLDRAWTIFTERAFFEVKERWQMHRIAVLKQDGEAFRLEKTWGLR
jgi:hypothetical protein